MFFSIKKCSICGIEISRKKVSESVFDYLIGETKKKKRVVVEKKYIPI